MILSEFDTGVKQRLSIRSPVHRFGLKSCERSKIQGFTNTLIRHYSTVHLLQAVMMNGEENIDLTSQQQSQDLQLYSNSRAVITMDEEAGLTEQQQSQDLQLSSNSIAVITMNGNEEADLTSQQQSQDLQLSSNSIAVITMNGNEEADLTSQQQSQDLQLSSCSIVVITMNGNEEADLTSQQQSQESSNNTPVAKNQELDRRKRQLYKCLKILLLSVFAVIGVSVLLVPSMIYYLPLPLVSFSSSFPQLYRRLNKPLVVYISK